MKQREQVEFLHFVNNGNSFSSRALVPEFRGTMKDYKAICRRVYGNLHGVKFMTKEEYTEQLAMKERRAFGLV